MRATMVALAVLALLFVAFVHPIGAADAAAPPAGPTTRLFNGSSLDGWRFRNVKAKPVWSVVATVTLDAKNPARLIGEGTPARAEDAIYLCGDDGRGSDLISTFAHGDCQLHVEFVVPKGSNSGIYLMGQYEVQVFDSFGKPDKDLKYGDCGGIYDTRPASTNATRPPGEWQVFEITFRAPRFDSAGKKIANARFDRVTLNGAVIQENVEVAKPTTSALGGKETATGPVLIQGDHGPVAYRNLRLEPLAPKP